MYVDLKKWGSSSGESEIMSRGWASSCVWVSRCLLRGSSLLCHVFLIIITIFSRMQDAPSFQYLKLKRLGTSCIRVHLGFERLMIYNEKFRWLCSRLFLACMRVNWDIAVDFNIGKTRKRTRKKTKMWECNNVLFQRKLYLILSDLANNGILYHTKG